MDYSLSKKLDIIFVFICFSFALAISIILFLSIKNRTEKRIFEQVSKKNITLLGILGIVVFMSIYIIYDIILSIPYVSNVIIWTIYKLIHIGAYIVILIMFAKYFCIYKKWNKNKLFFLLATVFIGISIIFSMKDFFNIFIEEFRNVFEYSRGLIIVSEILFPLSWVFFILGFLLNKINNRGLKLVLIGGLITNMLHITEILRFSYSDNMNFINSFMILIVLVKIFLTQLNTEKKEELKNE